MYDLETIQLINESFSEGKISGQTDVIEALRSVLDSMKSDNGSVTSQVMNNVLEEIYLKTLEKIND